MLEMETDFAALVPVSLRSPAPESDPPQSCGAFDGIWVNFTP